MVYAWGNNNYVTSHVEMIIQTYALCVVILHGKIAMTVHHTSQLTLLVLLHTSVKIVPNLHMDKLLNVTSIEYQMWIPAIKQN